MGYTHYWKLPAPTTKFDVEDAATIAKELAKEPVFGQFVLNMPEDRDDHSGLLHKVDEYVSINGYGSKDGSVDLGHENFGVDVVDSWTFCKTNRKPYDLMVVGTMALFEMAGIITKTTSDGAVNGFARNYKAAIRYSVEKCLDGHSAFDDRYTLPTVEDAIEAFERVRAKLEKDGLFDATIRQGKVKDEENMHVSGYPAPVWF